MNYIYLEITKHSNSNTGTTINSWVYAKKLKQEEVFKGKKKEVHRTYLDTKFISLGELRQERASAY
jgi:hypothetical protein